MRKHLMCAVSRPVHSFSSNAPYAISLFNANIDIARMRGGRQGGNVGVLIWRRRSKRANARLGSGAASKVSSEEEEKKKEVLISV